MIEIYGDVEVKFLDLNSDGNILQMESEKSKIFLTLNDAEIKTLYILSKNRCESSGLIPVHNSIKTMKVDTSEEPCHVKAADLEKGTVEIFECYPCPNCEKWIHANTNHRYCEWCGVKLDWSDEDDR